MRSAQPPRWFVIESQTRKLRRVESESFQIQVVLEKPERRTLAPKSQVFAQYACKKFLENATRQPNAL